MSSEMPKPKLPFLHRHRTRHGKNVYYVKLSKRQKGRGTRIWVPVYRSEKFMEQGAEAVEIRPDGTIALIISGAHKGEKSRS
jgi:hypothetical protein